MPNPFARLLLLMPLVLGACREHPDPATAFLRQHGGDDFSAFARTHLFVRSIDRRAGEARVLLFKPPSDGGAVYAYDYARQRSRFLKILLPGTPRLRITSADTALVQQFMRLNVTSLEVDPQGHSHRCGASVQSTNQAPDAGYQGWYAAWGTFYRQRWKLVREPNRVNPRNTLLP